MIWAAVLLGSLGCYLEKLFGFILPPTLLDRPMIRSVAALLPIAMLSALVAVQTFGDGHARHIWNSSACIPAAGRESFTT